MADRYYVTLIFLDEDGEELKKKILFVSDNAEEAQNFFSQTAPENFEGSAFIKLLEITGEYITNVGSWFSRISIK